MYREFSNIDELIGYVVTDKQISGSGAYMINRYPIRFVLFDNFRDSYEFVSQVQSKFNCVVKSVDEWLDLTSSDIMMTHTSLAFYISEYVKKHSMQDSIIAPFSELARFYNNNSSFEFDSLISTIKAVETMQEGFNNKQRVYIPIVGLEGKMSRFNNDSQINVWYYKNADKQLNYRLILSETTYNVKGLEGEYTLIPNVQNWLKVWKNKDVKPNIVSVSHSLFANACYARPDNAFDFCICDNIYDFLTKGLALDFGSVAYNEKDEQYWIRLTSEIDIKNFSFAKFFNQYFHIYDLSDYSVFLKTWFECDSDFKKWLLVKYYEDKFCDKGYICMAIRNTESLADYNFFASIALTIFSIENPEEYLEERNICLQQAAKKSVKLNTETQMRLIEKLTDIATNPSKGYQTAIRYFSSLTDAEKSLAISWLSCGNINKNDIKPFFPDLYNYLEKSFGTNEPSQLWILEYIDQYKQCKISNCYTIGLEQIINEQNKSDVTFNQWYQDFKTVKTILNNRSDIDVYYWIDGLGIDWIPYISQILSVKEEIYLNEIHIGRALCPTSTAINKIGLEELANNNLKKVGDLDTHAHKQGNKYPNNIIEEISIVKEAISKILTEYSGKKIAIVSDHGLSALSQFKIGLNLAGVKSNHNGRIAIREKGKAFTDNNFIILPDGKTMCALRHESLCGKIPDGQSAHGGCTPEEILVPIFIISSQKSANNYSVILLTHEISGSDPTVVYEIKGLSGSENLYVVYNGKRYSLLQQEGNKFYSERLTIVENVTNIEIHIGNYIFPSKILLNLGIEENDLFDL